MNHTARNIIYDSIDTTLSIIKKDNESNMICSHDVYYYLATMDYSQFTTYINLITDQKYPKNNPEYYIYTYDCNTNKIRQTHEVITEYSDLYHSRMEYEVLLERFKLRFISPKILKAYLCETNNQWSCFPLVLKIDTKDISHQICVAFDNINKKVYLIDPNGTITYFNEEKNDNDDELYFIREKNAEILIVGYLQELSKIGLNYEYIPINVWNNERYIINRNIENSVIGNGHCVATMLIIIHIIANIKANLTILYELFYELYDEELLCLINDYTVCIYKMFNK